MMCSNDDLCARSLVHTEGQFHLAPKRAGGQIKMHPFLAQVTIAGGSWLGTEIILNPGELSLAGTFSTSRPTVCTVYIAEQAYGKTRIVCPVQVYLRPCHRTIEPLLLVRG